MRERQRWRPEEDSLLCAYVKQYGSKEWHLISQRMNVPLHRDAKSCLERWKNYLRPGIKKGSLTEEEQRLVIQLQAKHGNKWKKIAAEVPGRTAKRLGKWWEVFKEKQQRELKERNKTVIEPIDPCKYDRILESFAEKLVKDRLSTSSLMAAPLLPPWLSNSNCNGPSSLPPSSPSVTLTLSPSTLPSAPVGWIHSARSAENCISLPASQQSTISGIPSVRGQVISELMDCCRELEEGHKAWITHKKEAAWRLRRVELQLESEKACKKREKIEETEAKIRKLKEEQHAALERIEADYRDQMSGLRREAEAKEQKVAEQWAGKHMRLTEFLEQFGYDQWPVTEPNVR